MALGSSGWRPFGVFCSDSLNVSMINYGRECASPIDEARVFFGRQKTSTRCPYQVGRARNAVGQSRSVEVGAARRRTTYNAGHGKAGCRGRLKDKSLDVKGQGEQTEQIL